MTFSRNFILNLIAGTILSFLFGALLVYQIMSGGVGTSITFWQFLESSGNIIFTLLMCSFVFASWLMQGPNNRVVLFSWAIIILIHQAIVWTVYRYFYYQDLNIYVLNFVSAAGTIPAVVFLRLRVSYSCRLLEKLRPSGLFRKEIDYYLEYARTTDFEFYMKQNMYMIFILEFVYAFYQTFYGLIYNIPYDGSIYEHMLQYKNWDPYNLYVTLKNIISCIYIFIIGFHLYRDRKTPDAFNYGVSDAQKRAISEQMLEKRRAKARKLKNKNRD